MPRRPTAKRYAIAAFGIARESAQLEKWATDLRQAQETLQDEAVLAYLELPKVALERKMEGLQAALDGVHPMVLNLLVLLTSRSSLQLLPAIVAEYQRLMDDHYNRERAEVVTAIPLEAPQRERVTRRLSQLLEKEVVLTTRVNPGVLGGMVARVGDRMIDASLRGRLLALRKSLGEAPE